MNMIENAYGNRACPEGRARRSDAGLKERALELTRAFLAAADVMDENRFDAVIVVGFTMLNMMGLAINFAYMVVNGFPFA